VFHLCAFETLSNTVLDTIDCLHRATKEEETMTVEGTIVNGTIVLDQPAQLPEGARVEVHIKNQGTTPAQPTLLSLLKLAGTAKDLPADFAAQHDHYIHGTPKR
jgi:hypothetical protein